MKKIIILMAIIAMNAGGMYLSADFFHEDANPGAHKLKGVEDSSDHWYDDSAVVI